MAVNNRDEFNSDVDTQIAATVTIAKHKTVLQDELADSIAFRKDVITNTVTLTSTAAAVNFDNDGTNSKVHDLYLLNASTYAPSITLSGVENGDVKYLSITKQAGNAITWVNATDVSDDLYYIENTATLVIYRITQKNSNNYVEQISLPPVKVDYTTATNGAGADSGVVKFAQKGNLVSFFGAIEVASTYASSATVLTALPSTIDVPTEAITFVASKDDTGNGALGRQRTVQITTGGNVVLLNGDSNDQSVVYYFSGSYLVI